MIVFSHTNRNIVMYGKKTVFICFIYCFFFYILEREKKERGIYIHYNLDIYGTMFKM
jgi:hypothetical protein